jgi:hypothetical protein
MKRLLFLLVALIYCNATWQAVEWGREFFWAFVAFLLIFLIPIVSGVALFLIFYRHVSEDWAAVFVGGGVLIPVVFMFSFATRMGDYVAFVQHGRPAFDGRIADAKDDGSLFYSVRDFVVKDPDDGHFGTSHVDHAQEFDDAYQAFRHSAVCERGRLATARVDVRELQCRESARR